MTTQGFLGIDAGTQGLSVIFTDEELNVLATGEGSYDMIDNLPDGCYEQSPETWETALGQAMSELREKLGDDWQVNSIGISGQMHGEVLVGSDGNCLGPARLWCDSRNEVEGDELTKLLGVKMPKRITAARWLWTLRNQVEKARQVRKITTPSGWIAHRLTSEWNLGIGDAAGMFPIDQDSLDYDRNLLQKFDSAVDDDQIESLGSLLPTVRRAGEDGGKLNASGAALLGLNEGIPIAPAEGDQPAALAGSLIGRAGMVSVSFGTSVCANSVGDKPFQGVSDSVDHFCAADGKPINMVWLRNGTTYMNTLVKMFGKAQSCSDHELFATIMQQVVDAEPDCGGILALPFMDDEPGLGVQRGGTAMLTGINDSNASPGNVVKAAMLATMFNLRIGSEVLDEQGFPRRELVLSGGLMKTPALAQVLADVFDTPVSVLESADEGTAFGAALMAKFRYWKTRSEESGNDDNWETFLQNQQTERSKTKRSKTVQPIAENSVKYESVYSRYRKLLATQASLESVNQ